MKNKPRKFYSLLIQYFAIFNVIIITIIVLVYNISTNTIESLYPYSSLYNINDNTKSLLESQQYDKINSNKLFGQDSYFDIINDQYNVVYSSNKNNNKYTKQQLIFINKLNSYYYNFSTNYTKDGNVYRYIFINYNSEDNTSDIFYLIDQNLNVIDTNDIDKPTKFNTNDLVYLDTEETLNNYVSKYEFQVDNKTYNLIAHFNNTSLYPYDKINSLINITYIAFIVIYILAGGILIYWIYKKVNRPLKVLNSAITDYSKGYKNELNNFSGPKEFQEIFENYNDMVRKVNEAESLKEKYEQDRQSMLADISHDLKTPITVINGYSKAIVDGVIPLDQAKDKIEVIYNKSNYLTGLINKFYEFSKLEHPSYTYDFKIVDEAEFVREYIASKYDELKSNNVNLQLEIADHKIMNRIDSDAMIRVFDNIINNAMKYGNTNITIKIVVNDEAIYIYNNGEYIKDEVAQKIFEPFKMGDESRSVGGSGLGLSIVQKIVTAHGFKITLIRSKDDFYTTCFKISTNTN